MDAFRTKFLRLAIAQQALCFGRFELKSGRMSPYFFNAGVFSDGRALAELAEYYCAALNTNGTPFDMLFGPAYKGIPLAAATASAYWWQHQQEIPFAYDRKEVKDHGEGGQVVGAPLQGRVMIIDDVISAGTSVRHSIGLIRRAGATPAGIVIALDRQERGKDTHLSAARQLAEEEDIPVIAIANLDQLIQFVAADNSSADLPALEQYREQYGAD